jgi:lysozyme
MKTSEQGINLIKHFESLHDGDLNDIGLTPKMCPAGIWTEGYGHAMFYAGRYLNGDTDHQKAIDISTVHNEADAVRMLQYDLQKNELLIDSLALNLKQNQFDAVVSFVFNVGAGNFASSTLLRRIIMKTEPELISDAFLMWNKCAGVELKGLTYRRQSEAELYLNGQLKYFNA